MKATLSSRKRLLIFLPCFFLSASFAQEKAVLLTRYDSCHVSPSEQRIIPSARVAVSSPFVRLAYVIPSNRTPQPNGVTAMQLAIKAGQQWFETQMEQNGFGAKTFHFETEADGVTPMVHVVHVAETDAYLREDLWGRTIQAATNAGISVWSSGELWVLIPETHLMLPDGAIIGGTALGAGNGSGNSPGVAMIGSNALPLFEPAMILDDTRYDGKVLAALGPYPLKQDISFAWFEGDSFSSIASSYVGALWHEMGHAFGLAHDYRNDSNFHGNLMFNGLRGIRGSLHPQRYPQDYTRLAYASALLLNRSHYFNRDKRSTYGPSLSYVNPGTVIPQNGLVHMTFQASDNDLLALAQLRYEGNTVAEIVLEGSTAEFTFAIPYFLKGAVNPYSIVVYDTQGNITYSNFQLNVPGGYNQAPVPYVRIDPPAPVNGSVVLSASQSSDVDHLQSTLLASWDVNNDGQFDTEPSANTTMQHVYGSPGNYLVRLKLKDPAGAETISTPVSIKIPGDIPPGGNGSGLKGEYFNNINLTGTPVLNRVDPQVNFSWNSASPATGINPDNFSVRWTGQVEAPASGNYVFSAVSDDGVRLWINGVQVIGNWTDHARVTNNSAPIPLAAGTRYDVKMEFYERSASAVARLLWAYPGQVQEAIPQSRLYPAGSTNDTSPPSIPSGLLVYRQPGETGFPLLWKPSTDNVGVTGYEIFSDGVSIGFSSETFFQVAGLVPGTTYAMTVRARDAAGNWSAQSAVLNVTTTGSVVNSGTGLSGAYYNNITLTGTPVLNRLDPQVNFIWNSASPGTGISPDNFSVRWTGQVEAPASGNFIFSTVSDDGVRLWINGVQVINNWTNHSATTNSSAAIPLLAGTRYDIVMEYYERTGSAVARLLWTYPGQAQQAIPRSRLYPAGGGSNGSGLAGAYFNNVNLTGTAVVTRVDPQVNFTWNAAAPAAGINPDNFSVRWTGQVEASVSGNFVFSTVSDDGVRLWINGAQVINNWTDHAPTTNNSAAIPLIGGTRYDITMEFYERTASAMARLLWAYPGQAQQPVPQSRLYPDAFLDGSRIASAAPDPDAPGTIAVTDDHEQIMVYPNPVSTDVLNVLIYSETKEEVRISIQSTISQALIDMRSALSEGQNHLEIPVHDLTSGVYLLKIDQGGRQTVRKVMVAR